MEIQVGVELCLFFATRPRTDSSSSSCEMIILRNKSHGKIIRVCMGIYTTALSNKKKYSQILKHRYLAPVVLKQFIDVE